MKKLLKEPLVHFFLIGAVLFVVYGLVNERSNNEDIIVDKEDVAHMAELWQLQWHRPPTAEELQGLIDRYVEQEVLYREALKLNLDHNDEIVKRRLAQKMEFLGNDLSTMVAPATEENVLAFYEKHKDNYQSDYVYSFKQIIFTGDHHQNPMVAAKNILKEKENLTAEQLKEAGDAFPLNFEFTNVDSFYINRELGDGVAEQLKTLETGRWDGPIVSGFGVHLVYIEKQIKPKIQPFEDVREKVTADYEYQMENDGKEAILNELKKKYHVIIKSEAIASKELAQNKTE
ncbi:peptidylprolyl isomerase [Neptunitalea lumnitzerae]|uniref:peptidylprolyl isomerase n=1 Tax=Neptunitalea lumnitzerae TaxID=2965509 RepID=A0ABQ5MEA6_9FLAO|nr:peptidylprolyl isomerase [Neptunitalea sp. Y10]GLB47709.1 hypothetical protein Y10_00770 [Neptunitalea sp. Y10]